MERKRNSPNCNFSRFLVEDGGFCVCAWLTGVKAFPSPILHACDLIGSFSRSVGLP